MPVWIFRALKKYWWAVALVVAGTVGYVLFKRYDAGWSDKYRELQSSHDVQIKEFEGAIKTQRLEHEKNLETLARELNLVTQRYEEQRLQLEARKKSVAKKIVDEAGDDPVELARRLSDVVPGLTIKEIVK